MKLAQNITEKKAAGVKEFLFTLVLACVCYGAGRIIRDALTSYKVIGDLVTIVLGCVLVYYVITRYAASYTYSVEDGVLKIVRAIGHKVSAVEADIASIKKISASKPDIATKNAYKMTPHILPNKHTRYVVFEQGRIKKTIIFEPSAEFLKAVKTYKHTERK